MVAVPRIAPNSPTKADAAGPEVRFENVRFECGLIDNAKGGGASVAAADAGPISGTTFYTHYADVTGTVQVNVGGRENVKFRVMHNDSEVCYADFCVCAHPEWAGYTDKHVLPWGRRGSPSHLGIALRPTVTSDSGGPLADLDKVILHEHVTGITQPDPPFGAVAFTGYRPALPNGGVASTTPLPHDYFWYSMFSIKVAGLQPNSTTAHSQTHKYEFHCRRCMWNPTFQWETFHTDDITRSVFWDGTQGTFTLEVDSETSGPYPLVGQ